MTIKFEPDDIERLKSMLENQPKALSAVSGLMVMQDLANNIKYPINCFGDIQRQLGKEETMTLDGQKFSMPELKVMIPAYYFPITCEEDFFDKAAELMKVSTEMRPEQMPHEMLLFQGEEMPIEMAPPIPPEIAMLKAPSEIPASGQYGVTIEEVERMKAKKGGE